MTGYLGVIKFFAGNFAPKDWMFCTGQTLEISEYTTLYAVIGPNFGGNGTTNFALPDLRQRIAIGAGRGPGLDDYYLAQQTGANAVPLTTNQMPEHLHSISAQNSPGDSPEPESNFLSVSHGFVEEGRNSLPYSNKTFSSEDPNNNMYHGTVGNTGNSTPHYNLQPYLVCNYIICVDGLFPTRN